MMNPEFVTYRKFSDLETAEHIASMLTREGIECHLQDDQHQYVKVVGYQQIEYGVSVNLKSEDFPKADKILERYYGQQIDGIEKDYYLFQFTEQELKEVVLNPYDWGILDVQLATKLLKEKGIEYTEAVIASRKNERIRSLSAIIAVPSYKLILGYCFAVFIPVFGAIMGLLIINNRNILPTGEKVYIHSKADRHHGQAMIVLSVICSFIFVFRIF